MADQSKMLFWMNTPGSGGPWTIVLDVGLDPPQRGKGASFQFRDHPPISGTAAVRDSKFGVYREMGALTKTVQK